MQMLDSSPQLPSGGPNRAWLLLRGMLAGCVIGGGLTLLVKWLGDILQDTTEKLIVIPSLFLIPFAIGLVAALCWRSLRLRIGQMALQSLFTTLVALVGAAVILREGAICLVIVSPLLYAIILAGVAAGRIWFRADSDDLRLSILPLVALLTIGEAHLRSDRTAVVTDEILIRAPPAKVWPCVLAFPEIPEPPSYWLFRIGLPAPMQTTNGGNFVGADRQCIFSHGIVVKERVAELVPNERLTFDVTEQPSDPEAYGHLTLHRGRFLLRDNGNGTTTLIGSSWYTLHVRPRWYFDLWMRDMTRAVHLRVMEHVRRLAEAGG